MAVGAMYLVAPAGPCSVQSGGRWWRADWAGRMRPRGAFFRAWLERRLVLGLVAVAGWTFGYGCNVRVRGGGRPPELAGPCPGAVVLLGASRKKERVAEMANDTMLLFSGAVCGWPWREGVGSPGRASSR